MSKGKSNITVDSHGWYIDDRNYSHLLLNYSDGFKDFTRKKVNKIVGDTTSQDKKRTPGILINYNFKVMEVEAAEYVIKKWGSDDRVWKLFLINGLFEKLVRKFLSSEAGEDVKIPYEVSYLYGFGLENLMKSQKEFEFFLEFKEEEIIDLYEDYCVTPPSSFKNIELPTGLKVNFRKFKAGECVEQMTKTITWPYSMRLFKCPMNEQEIHNRDFGCLAYPNPHLCSEDELQGFEYKEDVIFGTRTLVNGDILQIWYDREDYYKPNNEEFGKFTMSTFS